SAFPQRIDAPVAVAGDDGNSRGRRLEKNDAESLANAGHSEDVGPREVVGQVLVRDVACEHDATGDTGLTCQLLKPGTVVARTDDKIGRVGHAGEDTREGGDDAVVPLVTLGGGKAPDRENDLSTCKAMPGDEIVPPWAR